MELTPSELERYSRQIQISGFGENGQRLLKNTVAVVTGVGGLGGTVALYLAIAGVGKIILVRGGNLRVDDLNRQILMTNSWVGQPRVYKAKETILNINPDIEVEVIPEFVTSENVDSLVKNSNIAFDCAFDFTERDLLNTACVRWRIPMVEAAMSGMEAYLTTIIPGETSCLSCIFPEKPKWDKWGFGVLGAVSVGTAALLQDSVIHRLASFSSNQKTDKNFKQMIIEHPSGGFTLELEMSQKGARPMVKQAGLLRTTRMLCRGEVYIPKSIWDGKTG